MLCISAPKRCFPSNLEGVWNSLPPVCSNPPATPGGELATGCGQRRRVWRSSRPPSAQSPRGLRGGGPAEGDGRGRSAAIRSGVRPRCQVGHRTELPPQWRADTAYGSGSNGKADTGTKMVSVTTAVPTMAEARCCSHTASTDRTRPQAASTPRGDTLRHFLA